LSLLRLVTPMVDVSFPIEVPVITRIGERLRCKLDDYIPLRGASAERRVAPQSNVR